MRPLTDFAVRSAIYILICSLVFSMARAFAGNEPQLAAKVPSPPVHGIPMLEKELKRVNLVQGPCVVNIPRGTYHFYFDEGIRRTCYISNHDQDNPKSIGILLENYKDLVLDGQGSTLIFHGKMIPIVMLNCQNCTIRNFIIDFDVPAICQVEIVDVTPKGITFRGARDLHWRTENGQLVFSGPGWSHSPRSGIAFDRVKKNLVFNSSDIGVNLQNAKSVGEQTFFCPEWKSNKIQKGNIFAMRPSTRPAPALFLYRNKMTSLHNITIHYAEGMGVLAQVCDGIHLNNVSVCLKGENDPRYFTTQADATHFSGCKGLILSENSLFEGMMDDAINVHGTYLKVTRRIDPHTLQGSYMHPQSYGFHWGDAGDEVQFINSSTMEILGGKNYIKSIRPIDQPSEDGAKVFEIRFTDIVPEEISEHKTFGIENLQWTPEVVFRHNVIRNNRARGALFSTPRKTVVEDNLFDHTSGTAILLCGDCNGWFETGACRDVVIRGNRFVNALTCMFQFTNAVISIYPEIPNLKGQTQYFHGGRPDAILIENNIFETFDHPILYAKSTNGILFRNNTVKTNKDFPAWHWNKNTFLLERVLNFKEENNHYDWSFSPEKDIRRVD